MVIGEWVGADMPVPPAAVTLLKPNVIISKKFTNFRTGTQIQFLLVQCRDARDLIGHYPPVCYVANGWKLQTSEPQDWLIGGRTFHGTRYGFSPGTSDQTSPLVISNFMMIPGFDTCRDMQGVDAAGKDHRRRHLGAAQLQVVTSARAPMSEHEAILEMLVAAHQDLIEAVVSGAATP